MKRILAFCFFPAFVPPSNGGQSRLFNFYRALSRRHHVTLVTSTHTGSEEQLISHGVNFVERRIPKDAYFLEHYARLESSGSGGDLSGPALAACAGLPTLLHQAYLEEYERADVVIHDSPFTAYYDIFAGLDSKPRLYNAYNCETRLYEQLHPAGRSQSIHELVRHAELRLLEFSDLVLYCNDGDLAAFREMAPQAHFDGLYAPNGMQPLAATSTPPGSTASRPRAVFMGSGHPPNVQAAEFIVRELAAQLPDVDFDIIGSCLTQGQYPANVHRHGVVSEADKGQLLGAATLALNPMAAGSGSNVKVLDYFANGLPVLSTDFGMRGIQALAGEQYWQAPLTQFAAVLGSALAQPAELEAIGRAGKALALQQYTWNAIAGRAAEAIDALVLAGAASARQFVLALNDYDSFAGIGGGGTRTRGLYTAVSEQSPVVFVSFADGGQLQVRRHAHNITVINVPRTAEHLEELLTVNTQCHVSADDVIASRHCTRNPYLSVIYRVLRQQARCIVIEHCYMVPLPAAWGDRFVYSSQNNETELKCRLLDEHPLKQALLKDVERLERHAVENSAVTIAVSREDAEALVVGKRAAGPVLVVRNGAALPAQGERVEQLKTSLRSQIGERGVVFLGSAHMPNIEAARFITEQLAAQCPDVQFHLLGTVSQAITRVPRNVTCWGVVDDDTKSALMQSCVLAINPMLSGSGSNVKLADYIGNGLYVVTTEYGQRGYPLSAHAHLAVVSLGGFAAAVRRALEQPVLSAAPARAARMALFERELSMQGLAGRFVTVLQGLGVSRKRVLYVAYRYVAPALGGAEVNIEKFVSALGQSGRFDVDVVAPEVSAIQNDWRFTERYEFDAGLTVPVDIPNVRFARFPADEPDELQRLGLLRNAWNAQPGFERAVSAQLMRQFVCSGLAWGWSHAEGERGRELRWAFTECGLYLHEQAALQLKGYAPDEMVITAQAGVERVGGPWQVKGNFTLELNSAPGELILSTSAAQQAADPRPLGFQLLGLLVNGQDVDLAAPLLFQQALSELPAAASFEALDQAALASRVAQGVRLTDGRGPWSQALERYIADHVADYDLVIAHNNVFRPAVVAMAEAKKQGVPSILIPHAHLDDDFYHFPDWLQSAQDASLVLAAPRAAAGFLADKGCNVQYLPAGCDAGEAFTDQDVDAFRKVHPSDRPFVLVLGRKAGAKGYRSIIQAVEQLNAEGQDLQVVLIGPDDDGLAVESAHARYLGRQPREVVRGALRACELLCNMSSSESFGIVLLEAWLAGKPVIANRYCAAFHDMAVDQQNALLVAPDQVAEAIRSLLGQPELAARLAANGRSLVERFDWANVAVDFVAICSQLADRKKLGSE